MFLPMSWTSPLTVAVTIVPARRPVPARSASRYGMSTATAFFITRALFTTCGQEHPAGAEEVADDVHPGHQRALDHVERPGGRLARLLGVRLDERVDPGHEGVGQTLVHGSLAPGEVLRRPGHPALPGVLLGELEQPVRRIRATVQDDVLDGLAELRLDLVVDRQRPGVDDRHVEPRPDRVVQEDRVDRLADPVDPAEREGHVRDAAGGPRPRELRLQAGHGLDERDRVGVVLLHPGRDREDVRVEDDVLGSEPDDAGQQVVGATQDGHPPLDRLRLALLVEGHDDDRGPVAPAEAGLPQELGLALLEGDRVHDPLALELLQARPRSPTTSSCRP